MGGTSARGQAPGYWDDRRRRWRSSGSWDRRRRSSVSQTVMPDGMDWVLYYHNVYRCMHGVQLLQWDDSIADSAQTWATQGTCNGLIHSGGDYGENIYWRIPAPAPSDLYLGVGEWYNEIIDTDGGLTSDDCGGNCGHYTQLVWASTSSIGCGTCGGTMVCQYNPSGNFAGEYTDNVLPTYYSIDDCSSMVLANMTLV